MLVHLWYLTCKTTKFLNSYKFLIFWMKNLSKKKWPTEKDSEMSAISWISDNEWILRIKDSEMLEWVVGVKPNPTQREGEGMFLINP